MKTFCAYCKTRLERIPSRMLGNNYCDASHQLKYEYENQVRDKNKIIEAAHQKIRDFGQPNKVGKPMSWLHNPEVYKKVSLAKIGIRVPKLQSNNHWNWKGGVDKGIWFTWEYKQWRKKVFQKDKFTCQNCGDKIGGNLEAHHIKPRFLFPELIFDINNGQTLCKDCHKKTKTWGRKVFVV
jgi:predicted restriction endonuclease